MQGSVNAHPKTNTEPQALQPSVFGLTPVQRRALEFIRAQILSTGVAPTYSEIADHAGLSSNSVVSGVIERLERRGYIRRIKGRARSIEIVASARCPHCGSQS